MAVSRDGYPFPLEGRFLTSAAITTARGRSHRGHYRIVGRRGYVRLQTRSHENKDFTRFFSRPVFRMLWHDHSLIDRVSKEPAFQVAQHLQVLESNGFE